MAHRVSVAVFLLLAGCGSTIGSFDELPKGADVGDAAWPRLVDTPESPEARLTAGTGEVAAVRLGEQRALLDARRVRADAIPPVSDALQGRGELIASRAADSGSDVDEAALLARADTLRARSQASAVAVDDAGLRARALASRQRGLEPVRPAAAPRTPVPLRPLAQPVVSNSFEERARRAQQRAARATQ